MLYCSYVVDYQCFPSLSRDIFPCFQRDCNTFARGGGDITMTALPEQSILSAKS